MLICNKQIKRISEKLETHGVHSSLMTLFRLIHAINQSFYIIILLENYDTLLWTSVFPMVDYINKGDHIAGLMSREEKKIKW